MATRFLTEGGEPAPRPMLERLEAIISEAAKACFWMAYDYADPDGRPTIATSDFDPVIREAISKAARICHDNRGESDASQDQAS